MLQVKLLYFSETGYFAHSLSINDPTVLLAPQKPETRYETEL